MDDPNFGSNQILDRSKIWIGYFQDLDGPPVDPSGNLGWSLFPCWNVPKSSKILQRFQILERSKFLERSILETFQVVYKLISVFLETLSTTGRWEKVPIFPHTALVGTKAVFSEGNTPEL
mgnify:CR=1 FL=1